MTMTRWQEAGEAQYFNDMDPEPHPQPTQLGYWLMSFYWDAKHWVLRQICNRRGHDMVCEDWGGPESGGCAGHCNRCGFSYSHTLY